MAGVGMTPPKVPDHPVALVVGHDEQDIGRPLGRHDPRWPVRRGILGAEVDGTAELRRRVREVFPSLVVVALGAPGVPVICCARLEPPVSAITAARTAESTTR
jgi:hypothetical protein